MYRIKYFFSFFPTCAIDCPKQNVVERIVALLEQKEIECEAIVILILMFKNFKQLRDYLLYSNFHLKAMNYLDNIRVVQYLEEICEIEPKISNDLLNYGIVESIVRIINNSDFVLFGILIDLLGFFVQIGAKEAIQVIPFLAESLDFLSDDDNKLSKSLEFLEKILPYTYDIIIRNGFISEFIKKIVGFKPYQIAIGLKILLKIALDGHVVDLINNNITTLLEFVFMINRDELCEPSPIISSIRIIALIIDCLKENGLELVFRSKLKQYITEILQKGTYEERQASVQITYSVVFFADREDASIYLENNGVLELFTQLFLSSSCDDTVTTQTILRNVAKNAK